MHYKSIRYKIEFVIYSSCRVRFLKTSCFPPSVVATVSWDKRCRHCFTFTSLQVRHSLIRHTTTIRHTISTILTPVQELILPNFIFHHFTILAVKLDSLQFMKKVYVVLYWPSLIAKHGRICINYCKGRKDWPLQCDKTILRFFLTFE